MSELQLQKFQEWWYSLPQFEGDGMDCAWKGWQAAIAFVAEQAKQEPWESDDPKEKELRETLHKYGVENDWDMIMDIMAWSQR